MEPEHFRGPSSREVARPLQGSPRRASTALPADFPTSAGRSWCSTSTALIRPPRGRRRVLGDYIAAAGAHVLIASGRALEGVTPILVPEASRIRWALCNNGATLVQVSGGQCTTSSKAQFMPGGVASAIPGVIRVGSILLSAPFPNNEIEGEHRIVSDGGWPPRRPDRRTRRGCWIAMAFDSLPVLPGRLARTEVFVRWTSWKRM